MRLLTFGKAVIQSGVELDPVIHNDRIPQSNGVYFQKRSRNLGNQVEYELGKYFFI